MITVYFTFILFHLRLTLSQLRVLGCWNCIRKDWTKMSWWNQRDDFFEVIWDFFHNNNFWLTLKPSYQTQLGWVFLKCSYFLKYYCNYVFQVSYWSTSKRDEWDFYKNLFANTYRVSLVITKPFKTLNWGPKMLYFAILGICWGLNFKTILKQMLYFKSTSSNYQIIKCHAKKLLRLILKTLYLDTFGL